MQVLSVVGILQDEADPMVSVMKVTWPHHDYFSFSSLLVSHDAGSGIDISLHKLPCVLITTPNPCFSGSSAWAV